MPEDFWHEDEAYNEPEPISSLVSDLAESEDINRFFYRGLAGRRRKAAVALTVVWSGTIALHLASWGYWAVLGLTTLMGIHALRYVLARPLAAPEPFAGEEPEDYPFVSLLVAAKNEEAVIASLVKELCHLDYPADRYELWVVDDNSSDRTPMLLDRLIQEYPQLRVVHRGAEASGGKSGALNQVLPLAQGEILAVFDADAQVSNDLLRRVLPLFECEQVGAVQVRKAIANAATNFWTHGQAAEMAVDSYIQQQRIAIGGIGELRGNGQFVRRSALESCGGWNEETITDDLDLTLRLHLNRWDIQFLMFPAVQEEGVTRAIALWHQRNRWFEGGYQRYLDYWRLILRNRMGTRKTFDLLIFLLIQYILPTAAVPDFLMAVARNRPLILSPVSGLAVMLMFVSMLFGVRRTRKARSLEAENLHLTARQNVEPSLLISLLQTLRGMIYMLHWLPVVVMTTARISIRPKRLKWVKTTHHGSDDVWLDVSKQP
jgi:1,2-diacylglycerol 3-beta-glucosyltransferase